MDEDNKYEPGRYVIFEKAARELRNRCLALPHAETDRPASQIHVKLAESAERLVGLDELFTHTKVKVAGLTDTRDICALEYLACHRLAQNIPLPQKFKSEIDPLVKIIHDYVTTSHKDALIQAQELAKIIGEPSRGAQR